MNARLSRDKLRAFDGRRQAEVATCIYLCCLLVRSWGYEAQSGEELRSYAPHYAVNASGIRRLPWPTSRRIRQAAGRFRFGLTQDEYQVLSGLCGRERLPEACLISLAQFDSSIRRTPMAAFWMDRLETTVAAYSECERSGRCPPVPDPALASDSFSTLPVAFANLAAARAYCRFRGGRLPTKDEFERAARGATGRLFPWGNLYNSNLSNHGRFSIDPVEA
ncbi:MAG TPA: SUMF1/EgtB/PvdO family nonheme iron enzyme, partial [Polyangiaceae bacterium]